MINLIQPLDIEAGAYHYTMPLSYFPKAVEEETTKKFAGAKKSKGGNKDVMVELE